MSTLSLYSLLSTRLSTLYCLLSLTLYSLLSLSTLALFTLTTLHSDNGNGVMAAGAAASSCSALRHQRRGVVVRKAAWPRNSCAAQGVLAGGPADGGRLGVFRSLDPGECIVDHNVKGIRVS